MKFSYTALTSDNKKISGVFDVEDKAAAEAELHKMGVAIISLEEISDEQYQALKRQTEQEKVAKGIQTFTFVGIDANKKEAEGTIDAVDAYSAFKRLNTEYQFTVQQLFPTEATPEQQQQSNAQVANFQAQLDQEQAALSGGEEADEEKQRLEEAAKITAELTKEIDKVVVSTKEALEEYGTLFSNDLKQEIEGTLSELELIRSSNNIKHITEVTNNLYTLISNPDKIEGDGESPQYQALLTDVEESALVKKQFDLYEKALEATKAKKLFGNVAAKLKKLTAPKEGEAEKPSAVQKTKAKFHNLFKKLAKPKPIKVKAIKAKGKFGAFFESLKNYLGTKSPFLKKAQKKELVVRFRSLFKKKKDAPSAAQKPPVPEAPEAQVPAAEATPQPVEAQPQAQEAAPQKAEETKKPAVEPAKPAKAKKKRNFTAFFTEVDSFVAWLLSFYILYFFLVSFSLEKNIGVPRDFIFKTLKTPLILNISILLLIIHLALRTRNLHFRHNVIGSLFLFLFSAGVYVLLVTNF